MTPNKAEVILLFLRLTAAGAGGIITPAHALELIPLVEAFIADETIQIQSSDGWIDVHHPDFDSNPSLYRIKPKDIVN